MVPRLRFPGFDLNDSKGDYIKKSFQDVFVFSTGKNIKQNEASEEFKTPCVRYGELYHLYDEVIYEIINRTNLNKSDLHFSKGNEILLPSAGEDPLGIGSASALTKKGVAIGRTINILRPKENNIYNLKYVSYYINEKLKKKISRLARGASISNVYNSDLKTLYINLPQLKEQNKVASFLSSADDKISQLEKKKTLLETYKRGIMQKIFSQELRFNDQNGKEFPEWKEDSLENIFDHKKGTGLSGKELSKDGEFPCILYGALYTKYDEVVKNVVEFSNNPGKVKSISGDLLVPASTTTSGIDLANFTALNQDGVSLGGDITIMRNKEKGNNSFWAYYLTHFHKKGIARYAQGTTIVHLYFSHFKNLIVKYPDFNEQQKIASFLSIIDKKIEITSTQLEKTRGFKKGLLQQMFV